MIRTITREELKAKLDRGDIFQLVNVLSPASFEQGRIPNSTNVPLPEIEEKASQLLQRDEEIVVYCGSSECNASSAAARSLEKMGYTNVIHYEGGMRDWRDAGYEVHSGTEAAA